jgi:CRISPR-associated protein Cmr2
MKSHLIAISIGPVQDFIAAARRTRDLWFGSHMLSEIAKAAALAVHNAGGELIFPHPGSREKLSPETDFTVANIILAETNDPQTVRENAEISSPRILALVCSRGARKAGDMVRERGQKEQTRRRGEFLFRWTPVSPERYKAALERVMRRCRTEKTVGISRLSPARPVFRSRPLTVCGKQF